MSYTVHEETYKGLNIKIIADDNAESPREWDNIGKMLCWHDRYTLGDKKLLEQYSETFECSFKKMNEYNSGEKIVNMLQKEFNAVVILPLFLYDHSGISMRTYRHGHHASWDCGQVGYIYIDKKYILENYNVKKISKKMIEKVTKLLEGEVETYNDYLTGNIYGFVIENEEGEHFDSTWGYFGDYDAEYGALSEAKKSVENILKEKKELTLQY